MCGKIKFNSKAPKLSYCQKSLDSCCFSGLASVFASIKQTKDSNTILVRIEESFKSELGNCFDCANDIFKQKQN